MQLDVRGLKDVDEALVRLGTVAGAKVMRQAMFAASKPILDLAKANIQRWPGGSGALHLSMGRKFRIGKGSASVRISAASNQGNLFAIQIGPRPKVPAAVALHNLVYRRKRKGVFYGHLLEFGHRVGHRGTGYLRKLTASGAGRRRFNGRAPGGGGASAGSVPPQRFLRPALDAGGIRASFMLASQLKKRIERALKKQNPATDSV